MLTVGQYIDSFFPAVDGVILTVKNYAHWLNAEHGRSYVVAPEAPGYEDHESFPVYRIASLPLAVRPPYRIGVPLDPDFRRAARFERPDILHAHSPFGLARAAQTWAAKHKIPVVATFHSKFYDDFLEVVKNETLARNMTKTVMSFFNRADEVWTVNHATAQTLYEYGFRREAVIMPNGVDIEYPQEPDAARAAARRTFGLTDDVFTLLFVGQQIWQKNLKTLLEACALLRRAGLPFRLVMAGEGVAAGEIKGLSADLGLNDNAVFTGVVRDRALLLGLYLCADLFLFPSVYDNAPLVVREAAAMGCPSLLVKHSNAADGVIDRQNGFLAENSAEAIATYVLELAANPALRAAAGASARETIPVSWRQVAQRAAGQYERVIREYAEKHGAMPLSNWQRMKNAMTFKQ